MTYFATKFDSALTDLLYTLSIDWMTSYTGDSEAPVGWFTEPFSVTQQDLATTTTDNGANLFSSFVAEHSLSLAEQVDVLMALHTDSKDAGIESWFILRGDDQGFIWSEPYNSNELATERYNELSDSYGEWLGDENED